jgi:hypothetical protein
VFLAKAGTISTAFNGVRRAEACPGLKVFAEVQDGFSELIFSDHYLVFAHFDLQVTTFRKGRARHGCLLCGSPVPRKGKPVRRKGKQG